MHFELVPVRPREDGDAHQWAMPLPGLPIVRKGHPRSVEAPIVVLDPRVDASASSEGAMMRKLCTSEDAVFYWHPPIPRVLTSGAASVTIAWPAGSRTYSLLAMSGATVDGISQDRRTLTGTVIGDPFAALDPFAGDPIPCWLTASTFGQLPCNVVEWGQLYARLDAPLPPCGDLSEAILAPVVLYANIPAAHVPSSPVLRVGWTVTYTPIIGETAGAPCPDRGVLSVVRAPFATGLTDGELLRGAPGLRPATGHMGFSGAIGVAFERLVALIRPRLPDGAWEDQLSGAQFLEAHRLLTLLFLLEARALAGSPAPDLKADYEARLTAALDNAFARLEWVDLNDDGVVDDAEGQVGGFVSFYTTDDEDNRRTLDEPR